MYYRRRTHVRAQLCVCATAVIAIIILILLLAEYTSLAKPALCAALFPGPSFKPLHQESNTAARAQSIDARSLISAVERGETVSTKLIHQSWKSHDIPTHLAPLVESWKLAYPQWEHVLWDDSENKELVQTLYPWLLSTYESLSSEIYRADLVRNLYMHTFGGIYADLDSEAIHSLNPVFEESVERMGIARSVPVAFVGEMAVSQNPLHTIPNAFFSATQPGHPFWLIPLNFTRAGLSGPKSVVGDRKSISLGPEYLTGPVALLQSLFLYSSAHSVITLSENSMSPFLELGSTTILPSLSAIVPPLKINSSSPPVVLLPPAVIYPYSWDMARPHLLNTKTVCLCWMRMRTFDRERCQAQVGAWWIINYWGHSW